MAASADNTARAGKTWPELLALAFGAIYLLIGIIGFFITGFDNFAEHTDLTLLGFEINPLHNIVHILVGAAGIALSRTLRSARTFGWLLAVAYGATFLYGLFAAGREDAVNFLSLNGADNVLHLASALVLLGVALSQDKDTARGDVPGVPGV